MTIHSLFSLVFVFEYFKKTNPVFWVFDLLILLLMVFVTLLLSPFLLVCLFLDWCQPSLQDDLLYREEFEEDLLRDRYHVYLPASEKILTDWLKEGF